MCVLAGGWRFSRSGGGVIHDEAVSCVGPDWVCSSSEKQKLLLDGSKTAASTLLHRWSESVRHWMLTCTSLPVFFVITVDCVTGCLKEDVGQSWFVWVNDVIIHWCPSDIVSWPEVERLFHQSVLESMPLTELDRKGVLLKTPGPVGALEPAQQQTRTVIPWDNPLHYAKQQLHNLRTKGLLHVVNANLLWCLSHLRNLNNSVKRHFCTNTYL